MLLLFIAELGSFAPEILRNGDEIRLDLSPRQAISARVWQSHVLQDDAPSMHTSSVSYCIARNDDITLDEALEIDGHSYTAGISCRSATLSADMLAWVHSEARDRWHVAGSASIHILRLDHALPSRVQWRAVKDTLCRTVRHSRWPWMPSIVASDRTTW